MSKQRSEAMMADDRAKALEKLAETIAKLDSLLTVTTNKTAAHELVIAAILSHQDEKTLRAAASDLEQIFQKIPINDREGVKEATMGVWRTAGLDWPSGK